jgi:hypothetical protein
MDTRSAITRMTLEPRQSILLDHAAGTEVICREGRMWLTQYGDSRDIVLGPGQSFVLTLPSCLVMSASGNADFLLRAACPVGGGRRGGWLRRIAGLFDPRWGSAAQRALQGRIRVHHVA